MTDEPHDEADLLNPEESLPNSESLLDAFDIDETEAPPSRRNPKMLIIGSVLLGLAIWQFVHISNGGLPLFQQAPQAKQAPTKTYSERLMRLKRGGVSTNPVAAYIERAKRGMTDQEIRWMIGDFQALDLASTEFDRKGTLRAKMQWWYLQAMTEALELSPQQKAQAKAKMDALLEADVRAFEQNPKASHIPGNMPIGPCHGSVAWLFNDAYAPWNLCDLTHEQDQLTMREWRLAERKIEVTNQPTAPEADEPPEADENSWIRTNAVMNPLNRTLSKEHDGYAYRGPEGHALLGRIIVVDAFPLTPEQHPRGDGLSGLDQARSLMPSQLRMSFLMEPSLAQGILDQLDHSTRPENIPLKPTPETPVDPAPKPDEK